MTRIAFVSCERIGGIAEDDLIAAEALRARGAEVTAPFWTDASVDWTAFDAVVLRSTWDYYLRATEFDAWLGRLSGVNLFNPVATVRWNADKRYLLELEARGVPIVQTRIIAKGSAGSAGPAGSAAVPRAPSLSLALAAAIDGFAEAVLKPSISAGAHQTVRLGGAAGLSGLAAERALAEVLAGSDALVQPYLPEVARAGEWSVCFLGGVFSHAVLKRPAAGDFRTQQQFGARAEPLAPPAEVLAAATRALAASGQETLYARVDGVVSQDRFLLMELELIEPCLYFGNDRAAAERFATVLLAAGRGAGSSHDPACRSGRGPFV